jgi:hypothetical protein
MGNTTKCDASVSKEVSRYVNLKWTSIWKVLTVPSAIVVLGGHVVQNLLSLIK